MFILPIITWGVDWQVNTHRITVTIVSLSSSSLRCRPHRLIVFFLGLVIDVLIIIALVKTCLGRVSE